MYFGDQSPSHLDGSFEDEKQTTYVTVARYLITRFHIEATHASRTRHKIGHSLHVSSTYTRLKP